MSSPLTDRHSFSYDELIACAKGQLFGPGNALLPLPPMLMFDRIVNIDETGGSYGKGAIVAELDVNPELCFSNVTSRPIRSCRAASGLTRCGS